MVGLQAPPSDWQDAIHDAAIQFMNGTICFYEEVPGTPYDPITGAGGSTGIEVIWSGKARIQHLRSPARFDTDYQASATRYFRFQLDPDDNPPDVSFGAKARVLDGGRDEALEHLVFVVNSAINSSHKAVRTIELSSNMEFIDWDWPEDS